MCPMLQIIREAGSAIHPLLTLLYKHYGLLTLKKEKLVAYPYLSVENSSYHNKYSSVGMKHWA